MLSLLLGITGKSLTLALTPTFSVAELDAVGRLWKVCELGRRSMSETSESRRRIWSEHLPFEVVCRRDVLHLLSERSIQLIVAVQPSSLSELGGLVAACRDEAVDVRLWPLLDDELGRWPNDGNVEAFREHLVRLLACVTPLGAAGMEVVFDLEPPIATTRRLLELRFWDGRVRLRPSDLAVAAQRFEELANEVRSAGLIPTAVVAPMVVFDPLHRLGGWQCLLGTPVDGVGFESITVMVYTSLIEGYSRGAFRRRHARTLLRSLCESTSRRWPGRSSVALGVVGGGALGDEAPYRDVGELVDDVAVARAAGVDDLALFSLEGVLARGPSPEAWLDVFVSTPPAPRLPPATARATALTFGIRSAGHLFEACCRYLPVGTR